MKRFLSVSHHNRNTDIALLLMRLGFGFFMAYGHGLGKIMNYAEYKGQFLDFMGLGPAFSLDLTIFAEFFCSIFIFLGLGTRLAAIPLIITMLVAITVVHSADPFAQQEMAWHYLLIYVILLIMGSGRYSLDAIISKD